MRWGSLQQCSRGDAGAQQPSPQGPTRQQGALIKKKYKAQVRVIATRMPQHPAHLLKYTLKPQQTLPSAGQQ